MKTGTAESSGSDWSPVCPFVSRRDWLLAAILAVGLTMVFWWPLWNGGGLIGGDIYSYFFPQKQFFAESLQAGAFPFWNDRSGFGYPLIAESQTGAFYPPHLALYPFLELNTAYNACQILHYCLAFVFCWRLARELGLQMAGSLLAALIYTYGWFPPRLCLEWAILGGAWLPLAVFFTERFLNRRKWRDLAALSLTLTVQMLAGHYNLAFITQLLVAGYAGLRLAGRRVATAEAGTDFERRADRTRGLAPGVRIRALFRGAFAVGTRRRAVGQIALSLTLALGLAAPQLLPTWELKRASQREQIDGREFDPGHGHIPPLYLSQVVASWWFWYTPDVNRDQALQQLRWLAISSGTNQTEAHLYFGLAPLLILATVLCSWRLRSELLDRRTLIWLLLSLASVIYATGWLLPVTQHLPGFGFFRGPGRYGIVATLGIAIVAGRALMLLTARWRPRARIAVSAVVFALTAGDLLYVSRVCAVSVMLPRPVLQNLEQSPIRRLLSKSEEPVRVYGPGPNLPNLLGVSSVPEYLGIGPAEYYDPALRAPQLENATLTADFLDWARRAGITHILTFDALRFGAGLPAHLNPGFSGHLQLIHEDGDPFLNPVWARPVDQPLFLYRMTATRGRAAFAGTVHSNGADAALLARNGHPTGQRVVVTKLAANSVSIEVESEQPAELILTDLQYPGWTVAIDGEVAEPLTVEGQFRGVNVPGGRHQIAWTYRPVWLPLGVVIAAASGLFLCWPLLRRKCRNVPNGQQ